MRFLPLILLAVAAVLKGPAGGHASETVSIPTDMTYFGIPVTLHGELHQPDGEGPFPAVILMHGCGGWQAAVLASLRSHAGHLVSNGFSVLNLDSFGPRKNSGGWVCDALSRLSAARAYRARDAFEALKFLRKSPRVQHDNIFLMGQSNGGSVAIVVATGAAWKTYGRDVFDGTAPRFRAVAAYYPWCGAFGYLGSPVELVSPLIVFGGAKDDWVPAAPCRKVETTGGAFSLHIYPDAAHSFDLEIERQLYLGHLVGYDPQATHASRRALVSFFKDQMPGGVE